MSLSKNSKMLQFVNYRMRVTLDDRRTLVGRFMAFDKHMNVVLADCEEFRISKKDKEERRALGLVLLRGESVVSIAVESPPAASKKPAKRTALEADLQAGMAGVPAGRGSGAGVPPVAEVAPVLPLPGLPPGAVPPHGVPPIAVMQPQLSSDPRLYGPPPVAGAPPFARGAPIVPAVPPIPPFPHGGPAPNAMPMPPPQVAYGRGMPPGDMMGMPPRPMAPQYGRGRGGGRGNGTGGPSAPTSG